MRQPIAALGRTARVWSTIGLVTVLGAGCINGPAVLTQHVEAQRLAADIHVQFAKASDAANRAVMADSDEASIAFAQDAKQLTALVQQDLDLLEPLLRDLNYSDEVAALRAFAAKYVEYRSLDDEILPLAVENTNLKAQRLSFGPARDAVGAFRVALRAAVAAAPATSCCQAVTAGKAVEALLEIQVIQARHIAESNPSEMAQMESAMQALDAGAAAALDDLRRDLPGRARADLDAAAGALTDFRKTNAEIVELSRRNSNVRSLALTLGRKRVVTAECDSQLKILEDALARHDFKATR